MANTWETLDRAQQMELCRHFGAKTGEDHNRIAQHLAQNPKMVDQGLKETGIVDPETDNTLQEDDELDLEGSIDSAMAESAASDVQETGKVASDIPPAEPGEGIEEYMMRLGGLVHGIADNSNPGNPNTLDNAAAEIGMLQGADRVRQQFKRRVAPGGIANDKNRI